MQRTTLFHRLLARAAHRGFGRTCKPLDRRRLARFGTGIERLERRALLSLSIRDAEVVEGDSATVDAVFTVSLAPASMQRVTVSVATADFTARAPADYTAVPPTTLTFEPGETEKTIAVAVNGDAIAEQNEFFTVNLSKPTNTTIADGQ